MLFIIQLQTTELWLKLILHELGAPRDRVRADELQPAFKMLARVGRIMTQLIQAWDVLATLTPSEYAAFREALGRASGFQSYQFRFIEFMLGNRQRAMIDPHRHRADLAATLEAEPGTGGTAGVAYLRELLDVRLFPELWDLRTQL